MAIYLDPSIVTQQQDLHCDMELAGACGHVARSFR
jgi:hypothetical protein